MNRIASAILVIEVLVLALAVPVAINLSDVETAPGLVSTGVVAILCVLSAGTLRRGQIGYVIGSVAQVGAIGIGFIMPTMFILGAIFAAMWFTLLRLGPQVERARPGNTEPQGDGHPDGSAGT